MAKHLERTHTDGGLLHVITDHARCCEAIEPRFDRHAAYERLPEFGGESFPIEIDRPLTNHAAKYAVAGRASYRGSWRRVARWRQLLSRLPHRFAANRGSSVSPRFAPPCRRR